MSIGSKVNSLEVFIGQQKKIATLSITVGSETEMAWVYEPDWIKQGFAISPYLPLNGEFEHRAVRNFLQNLLPEGHGFEELVSNTTLSKNNIFGLIKVIGEETSGALSFRPAGTALKKTTCRQVSDEELHTKLSRFKAVGESITFWDGRTRLSVAGVQDKLNLLETESQFGFGEGALCSNKIFKFETGKAPFIAVNELFTMLLAGNSGLRVPNTELRTYGGVRAFVIERFDRRVVTEHNQVLRRHIIDGCQASNLPPSYKYERQHGDEGEGIYIRDGVSFGKLFAIETVNQEAYHAQLVRWMTFNLLVGNYDAHGKNISFFVGKQGLEITPFYDLVSVEAIIRELQKHSVNSTGGRAHSISQHFAMSIGEYEPGTAGNFSKPITAYMLADFANEFGISLPRMELLMAEMINAVVGAVDITKSGAQNFDLSGRELQHIELCIAVIQESAEVLLEQVTQLTDMQGFF